ncbi:MAG: hypothetical protein R2748_08025 [Bryobacterales bacterium]
MALWDIAGKAYNIPAYQMLGGKFAIRFSAATPTRRFRDPKEFAARLKKRKEEFGFTFLKMDLGTRLFPEDSSRYLT